MGWTIFHGPFVGVVLASTLAAASPSTGAGSDRDETLQTGSTARQYHLHLPPSSPAGGRIPLVLVFHGGGGTGRGAARLYGFNALADARGVAVAYPEGLDHHWNDGRGATGQHWLDTVLADDVGFVFALIDHLIHTLRIDPRRVYATGISNGAILSHRLGCDLSGRIAAIAPVAGTIAESLAPRCAPHTPVSVVEFHGTDDRFVPYGGGEILHQTERGKVLSVAGTMALWARLNGCGARPQGVDLPAGPPDGTRVHRASYGPCARGSEVVLYTIEGGGHTWPGSAVQSLLFGPTSHQINTTETIWEFFERHPK